MWGLGRAVIPLPNLTDLVGDTPDSPNYGIVLSSKVLLEILSATKYRTYPNDKQKQYLAQSFGCCRFARNSALNRKSETYKATGKGLNRFAIQKEITKLKKEYEWLTEPYAQC